MLKLSVGADLVSARTQSWWDEVYKKNIRTSFIISLSIHVLLFLVGGVVFVKTAQYDIQSVPESIQVELVQPQIEKDIFAQPPPVKLQPKPFRPKREQTVKPQPIHQKLYTVKAIGDMAKPDYFQNPAPEYPELARQMRQEGLVMVSVDVDREGIPSSVQVVKSSGYRLLDQAALKTVRHWKFQPGRIGTLPVESTVTIPIKFRLE